MEILAGRRRGKLLELVGKMTLVHKTALQCHLGERHALTQKGFGQIDAALGSKQVRWQAGMLFKDAQQMISAQTNSQGQVFKCYFLIQMGCQILLGPPYGMWVVARRIFLLWHAGIAAQQMGEGIK